MRVTVARRDPSTIAAGGALLLHLLLALVFLIIQITVKPMASPPLEVELLAGDVSTPDERVAPRATPSPSGPQARRGDVAPLLQPAPDEHLLPDLPPSTAHDLRPAPPVSRTGAPSPGPSPGSRLSPVPVASGSGARPGVNVRVEGTLSTRRLVHLVNPAFPPQASSGGVVKVSLVVRADGTVRTVALALKAHPLLDEAALAALRQWRFAPASGAADAEGVVTVEFVLR